MGGAVEGSVPRRDAVGMPRDEAGIPDPWDEELVDGEGNFGGARAEFAATWFDCEANPFTGKPFFNETVFVHKPSRVLFVTDVFWNYPDGKETLPLGTKAWKFGMDRVYLPFYRKAMVTDATRFAAKRDALLGGDAFDAVLPCHGAFVASGGAELIAEHLAS